MKRISQTARQVTDVNSLGPRFNPHISTVLHWCIEVAVTMSGESERTSSVSTILETQLCYLSKSELELLRLVIARL